MHNHFHFTIRLTKKQIKRLKKIYKTEQGRPSQRAHIVLLYHQGYNMKEIASICLCDRNTISEVLQRFTEHGFEGLYDQKRSGAPKILNEEDEQYLFEALEKSPLEYGYRLTVWTVGMMIHLLRTRRKKTMSESALRELLHKRGWVFKRPKHIPAEALPLDESEKQEILRLLNNPEPNEIILFLDESDFQWL